MRKSKVFVLSIFTLSIAFILSGCSLFNPPELEINTWELNQNKIPPRVEGEVTNIGGDMGSTDSCEITAKFYAKGGLLLDTGHEFYFHLDTGERTTCRNPR